MNDPFVYFCIFVFLLTIQRNNFRDKNERLNMELNYILHNDDRRIVDIDAIVLENQYGNLSTSNIFCYKLSFQTIVEILLSWLFSEYLLNVLQIHLQRCQEETLHVTVYSKVISLVPQKVL